MTFEDYNYKQYNEWILINPNEETDGHDTHKKCKQNRKAASSDKRMMEPTKRRLTMIT